MNEATLEARIHQVLSSVFPTFLAVKVEHQRNFTIRIGHHNVTVDLKEPSAYPIRAIFDVLLTIDNKPVILLELKNENIQLEESDVDQGISYARLIDAMPPLTLISNGRDNWFYKTYTKERLTETTIDLALIQQITNNSFRLAQNDFKNAVSTLLNNDTEVFAKIINQITSDKFLRMTGELDDFSKPLSSNFLVKRELIEEIKTQFISGQSLVGVIASAFSGKTNLLYEFFLSAKNNNAFVLYLDCSDHNYSILQKTGESFY